ncbi:MAG: AAA family ATPase [Candidatus Scalindua sp.]|nr:AAA family ATPase [Candidatus Scalindua sp.]
MSPSHPPKKQSHKSEQTVQTRLLGVAHCQGASEKEGLLYILVPVDPEEVVPEPIYVPVRWPEIHQHIEEIRRQVEELTRRAVTGQEGENRAVEAAACALARQVFPASGFVSLMGAGRHPQFDILQDSAAEISWEVLVEYYFVCPNRSCRNLTAPYWVQDSPPRYCDTCGRPMGSEGGKLALTYHLTHLVRGQGRPAGNGREFLFIEDPTGDLCWSDTDPDGHCAKHLSSLHRIIEHQGYRINLLRHKNTTIKHVLNALADPSIGGMYYFGHGYFPRDGDQGCLVLADGMLFASRIEQVAPAANWVFLNACEGAAAGSKWDMEKGAGSIAHAFARGDRSKVVVAPLWPLVNVQAAEMALTFFQQAAQSHPAAEALRTARLESLKRYEAGAPHLAWMAYRYFGDPNRVFCVSSAETLTVDSISDKLLSAEDIGSLPPQHPHQLPVSRGQIKGERRQVTVLFADMKEFTPLAESLGEEATYLLMDRIYERMVAAVNQEKGTVQELTGDGILALFGVPVALEDAPVRACRAALEIQAQMRLLRTEIEAEHGVRPQMRIGIHTGPAVVGMVGTEQHRVFKAVGDTLNLASRLESIAEPDRILMSEATYCLVEGYTESAFVGERTIRGKETPQRVYRLEGLKSEVTRFGVTVRRGLTPFVGRERELEILQRRLSEAVQGAVQVVNVMGEAGIGKSRLVHEFRQRLEPQRFVVLQGHCTADDQSTPFFPILEVVRSLFHLRMESDLRETQEKLRMGLEPLGLEAEVQLPFLLNLLGMQVSDDALRGLDGENIGRRTRQVLQELVCTWSRLSPMVLFIEDVQWVDTATEELLLWVAESMESLPLLFGCTCRPSYRPPWSGRPNVTVLDLQLLPKDITVHLLRNRLGIDDLPVELIRLLVEKSGGNPLFAEEIVNVLQEQGSLHCTEEGVSFCAEWNDVFLPGTLQNLLMHRVDRLDEESRTVLQAASIIGQRFSLDLISYVTGGNGTVTERLCALEAHDLIFCEEIEGQEEFRFKHVLVKDAIYHSLLSLQREVLHQRVCEAIEHLYASQLEEWVEVLAHHYSRTSCVEKTVYYLTLAGEKSLRVYSLNEADRYFYRAMELIEAVPSCVDDLFLTDVLLSRLRVYSYRRDSKGTIDLTERYFSRVEATGDKRHLCLLTYWLGYSYTQTVQFDKARTVLERGLALGEELGDEECIAYVSLGLIWLYWMNRGDQPHDIVERLGDRVLEVAGGLNDIFLASACILGLAFHKIMAGHGDDARCLGFRLLELGRSVSDLRSIGMGLCAIAWADVIDERYQKAIDCAEEALHIEKTLELRLSVLGAKGAALALMGRGKEGAAILREIRREAVEYGYFGMLLGIDIPYGAAMIQAGEMAAGVRWIETAIRRFEAWGCEGSSIFGKLVLGEIYLQMVTVERKIPLLMILRNLGFLLRTLPFAARKARHHLEEVVQRARKTGMPEFLARSLLNLGLLCKAKKRYEEARQYLEEAQQIVEPLELLSLREKIDTALESLNSVHNLSRSQFIIF